MLSVLTRTRSMTWMTPFGRRTSGWMICAVALPEVTKWPVALNTKESGSPAAEVRFELPSSGE